MPHHGWHQIAFASELNGDLTPAAIGRQRLIVARTAAGIGVFAADCPHRGAHLAQGRLAGDAVICPFHGYRVALGGGEAGDHGFAVPGYAALAVAGAIFARHPDAPDHGFAAAMAEVLATFEIAGGFTLPVAAPAALVIENAFDAAHFAQVHDVHRVLDFAPVAVEGGALAATALFEFDAADRFQNGSERLRLRLPYRCTAFSPGLVLSRLGGDFPYATLTGATPTADGGAIVRFTLALPPGARNGAYMLDKSREGLLRDAAIWRGMAHDRPARFTVQDTAVVAFRDFCARFPQGEIA